MDLRKLNSLGTKITRNNALTTIACRFAGLNVGTHKGFLCNARSIINHCIFVSLIVNTQVYCNTLLSELPVALDLCLEDELQLSMLVFMDN
jgi:hypothetical protein